jgi:hypothetical protein
MAAPTPTTRGTPTGIKLDDGYRALITLSNNTTISFWEKKVQPPGADGGGPVDTTTMHNNTYRTMSSRALITLTEISVTVAYDPGIYTAIMQQINREQTITVLFPDGSTVAFYGFLQKFEPSDLEEGNQPEAKITITPTNYDPTNRVEAGPTITSVSGT